MRKSHLSFLRATLIASSLLLIGPTGHAQQTIVTDSGIVVPVTRATRTTRPTQYYTTTYNKVLANPKVLYEGGQKVVEFAVSFMPKGKDYYGPFITTGNRFSDKAISALKKAKADEVSVTRMFIEGIGIKERDSIRHINGSIIITVTP